ncbi:Aste57867_16895 [Aphanomyces stellatus]|uniref:Aste57867_16895 protein n=1 Tax=Aphanomyces stellatus TaxID=120398 RepID=A0A485L6M3_9STRA|nr:hypothetical protein As57867_016837 [Aphanomyces stellatus]VFT93658.1 Aste57867_16895 [Aphanomyces stellatus]
MADEPPEIKMEIDIDPERLKNRRKKRDFFQKRENVLKGVGAKAAELRRRLFNRQAAKIAEVGRLPMVQKAKRDAIDIRMGLVEQDVKARMIDVHTHTQFELEDKFRVLNNNIRESSRNVRDSNWSLDDLTRRIERMQETNHDSVLFTTPPARKRVEKELQVQHTAFLPREECSICGKLLATPTLLELHEPYCRGKVSRDLPTDMLRCPLCHRVVKTDSMEQHNVQCEDDQRRRKLIWSNDVYAAKGQPPKPPTHFRLVQTDHHSITVAWTPPVFTAGLDVVDYEVQIFVLVVEKFQLLKHRQHERTFASLPNVPTSRWNRLHPVASAGFTIYKLTAKTTYGKLAVRCKTENGWSDWSNEIADVVTGEPTPATAPLFLTVGLITVDSIALSWMEPFDTGGEAVIEYVVAYAGYVQVQDGKDTIDLSASELKDFTRRMQPPPPSYPTSDGSSAVTFTLDGLRSGQSYSRIRVFAVTASGLVGQETPELAAVRTLVHGKEMQMLAELQEAINSPASYIDSAFYNGFFQRYERKHYIQLVAETVKLHHPTLSERVDAMLPVESDSSDDSDSDDSSDSTSDDDDASDSQPSTPEATEPESTSVKLGTPIDKPETLPMSPTELIEEANRKRLDKQLVRRKQFQYRLHQLRTHVETLQYNITWADDRCIVLVSMMEAAEQRIMDKQAELERARGFKGPSMDSMAMHGGLQRFYTPALITALEEELDIEKYYIVDTKEDLRIVEDQKKADVAMLVSKRHQIQKRLSVLDAFETECEVDNFKAVRGASVMLKFKHRNLHYCFVQWQEFCLGRRDNRAIMTKSMTRLVHTKVGSAWQRWVTVVRKLHDRDLGLVDIIGKGGKNLKDVHVARTHLQSDCYHILHQMRELTDTLENSVHTVAQNSKRTTNVYAKERKRLEIDSKVLTSMRDEADTQLEIGEYDIAVHKYDALIAKLAEFDDTRAIQIQTSQAYNHIGRAYYLLDKLDHAATAFERAGSIANLMGDPYEGAVAFRGRADCYMSKREWLTAMDYYFKAAGAYEDVSDVGGEVAAWRGLAGCYHEMDAVDLAKEASTKADSLEHALNQKMDRLHSTLDNLHSRLIGVTVQLSVERHCERVGAIVPRLRQERINCKVAILEEEKVLVALETMLEEKKALKKQAEKDLKHSELSDSPYVDSAVFLGVSTRYTVDEFKANVEAFIKLLEIIQTAIATESANSKIRISNQNDRIQECEEELKAETGSLMRRVRGKDPLRCFRFNAVNAMYKDVLGHASGGVDTAIATSGTTIYVYDLLSGVCLGQGVGDVGGETRHLGEPLGHTKMILCVYCLHSFVYTGGMDCTLLAWQLRSDNVPVLRCRLSDFDAAVTSIGATIEYIAAGTADCCIVVHDAVTYARLVMIPSAHYRSITFLAMDLHVLCSGGADNEIRFWEIHLDAKSKGKATYKRGCRLRAARDGDKWKDGHTFPISCVHFAANEVVSGDTGGSIVVWDSDLGSMRRQMQVHACAVTCLAFDTLRIVSGGADGTICVSDLVSGLLLQTLHGHTTKVLDVQVDRLNLVSCSEDGVLRQWQWHARNGEAISSKRFHILGPGETLKSVSLLYRTSVAEIREWNRIDDVTKLYLGQQLLVQKELPPDETASHISPVLGKLCLEDTDFLVKNRMAKSQLDQRIADLIAHFKKMEDEKDEKKKEVATKDAEGTTKSPAGKNDSQPVDAGDDGDDDDDDDDDDDEYGEKDDGDDNDDNDDEGAGDDAD